MFDCAIASGRPVPDGRLISRIADEAADSPPDALSPASAQAPAACRDLLELLTGVADGRPGQGRDHPVAAVLALAAAALAAGSRSFTAIAGWAADVPAGVLEDLYRRCGAVRPDAGPPSKATIWRVVTGADTTALDAVTGAWLMERASAAGDLAGTGHGGETTLVPVRVDGKTVRGARNTDGSQVHLLAALAGTRGVVAAQAEAGAKTNEIPMIIPLPGGVGLDGAVVTADALHTQRATADYVHGRGADFAFPVKDNQPGLSGAPGALPWRDVPVSHATADRGHGRVTTRTIQVLDAPGDLPFRTSARHISSSATSPRRTARPCPSSPRSASPAWPLTGPARHASPGSSAASGRSSPCTGSATPCTEDNSTVRTRSGPRAMAALRNLAIGALHQAGRHDTTEATRWASRYIDRPFTILGLN